MLSVTFGTRTGSVLDPLIMRALPLGNEFMKLTGPWSNAVDFIKPLQWLPTRIRSRGRKLRQDFLDVYGAMITQVKEQIDSGKDVPDCLVKTLLEVQEEEKLSWTDMCLLTTAFATGGSHSVSNSIFRSFFFRGIDDPLRHPVLSNGSSRSCHRIPKYRLGPTKNSTASSGAIVGPL